MPFCVEKNKSLQKGRLHFKSYCGPEESQHYINVQWFCWLLLPVKRKSSSVQVRLLCCFRGWFVPTAVSCLKSGPVSQCCYCLKGKVGRASSVHCDSDSQEGPSSSQVSRDSAVINGLMNVPSLCGNFLCPTSTLPTQFSHYVEIKNR